MHELNTQSMMVHLVKSLGIEVNIMMTTIMTISLVHSIFNIIHCLTQLTLRKS